MNEKTNNYIELLDKIKEEDVLYEAAKYAIESIIIVNKIPKVISSLKSLQDFYSGEDDWDTASYQAFKTAINEIESILPNYKRDS